jgi:hypothetical protein
MAAWAAERDVPEIPELSFREIWKTELKNERER